MITEMANIPFSATLFAEWSACVIHVFYLNRRWDRKRTAALCVAGLFLQYFVMQATSYVELHLGFPWYFRMFPFILFMFFFILSLIDCKLENAVFLCCKSFIEAEMMASAAWGIYSHMVISLGKESDFLMAGSMMITYGCILALTVYLESSDREYFNNRQMGVKQNSAAVILCIIMFYFSNRNMMNAPDLNISETIRLYDVRMVFDIFGYVIIFLLQKMMAEREMISEISMIKNTLNTQYTQYVNFRETSEYISRQCHDLKHQIDMLRFQTTEADRESYLEQMENKIKYYDSWISTGNSTLDTILTQKNIYCQKHGIELNCQVDGTALNYLAVRDICSIFGNILDNAIEAVVKYEDEEKRVIHGEVSRKQGFLVIRFENYFEDRLEMKGQTLQTTKTDKERHGYGIKSIQYTVKKYGGNFSISQEKNWVVLKIIIPVK